MAYRTDLDRIIEAATPILDWGVSHGTSVRIALERGPLPDETILRFWPAGAGTLWLVPIDGSLPLLILLDRPEKNPIGRAFAEVGRTPAPGSNQTFHPFPECLLVALPHLDATFSAWPSFIGMAIHGMD